ncbi:hypothetical protein [Amycolatopsis aidingensis]|uniref:hypothetical protein n=1 Tax=Amycolatopsis aidingensis TaxID=2842453 RepID=UPI001C0AE3D1|nr:hypothetical protein [Amycolatopsis aidingensis]
MAEAITATYVREDKDWSITVSGLGKELTARAPGIIAARDRADQLVEELGPDGKGTTVVHLLDGSALEFTTAYMTARLARTPAEQEAEEPQQDAAETTETEDDATPESQDDAKESQDSQDSQDEEQDQPELPQQLNAEGQQATSGKPTVPTKELTKDPQQNAEKDAQPASR